MSPQRVIALLLGLLLFSAACSIDEALDDAPEDIEPSTAIDTNGSCLPDDDAAEDQESTVFNTAYEVVDGELGEPCFGSANETVEWAWNTLADLVPVGQRRDLTTFAGFTSSEDDNVTLAFVQRLDDDGTEFLMAVNIDETRADQDEATLTMAHEFTHIFTALPSEIDRTTDPEDCEGFANLDECYWPDSIIDDWHEEFWQDAPGDPTDEGDADQRCDIDSGFFGNYAASSPEEDFAESFSAYVLRVEALTDGQQDRLDWIDEQPGLREIKDRAVEKGYGPLDHNFDRCG